MLSDLLAGKSIVISLSLSDPSCQLGDVFPNHPEPVVQVGFIHLKRQLHVSHVVQRIMNLKMQTKAKHALLNTEVHSKGSGGQSKSMYKLNNPLSFTEQHATVLIAAAGICVCLPKELD